MSKGWVIWLGAMIEYSKGKVEEEEDEMIRRKKRRKRKGRGSSPLNSASMYS